MKRERFWLVCNPSGRAPTHRHISRESADTEADRLASSNPGQDFIVMKAVGGVSAEAKKTKIEFQTTDGIPF